MREGTSESFQFPAAGVEDTLTQVLRDGAQKLLAQAVEAEVTAYVERHADQRDPRGYRLVVRNGHKDERQIQTGIGPVAIRQPRVDDRRVDAEGHRIRFTSSILPPYLRRTQSLEELIPWLYLKGISTGEFSEALAALLGPGAPDCRPRRWFGSRKAGRRITRPGASDPWPGTGTCTSGWTGFISTSAWKASGSASWW